MLFYDNSFIRSKSSNTKSCSYFWLRNERNRLLHDYLLYSHRGRIHNEFKYRRQWNDTCCTSLQRLGWHQANFNFIFWYTRIKYQKNHESHFSKDNSKVGLTLIKSQFKRQENKRCLLWSKLSPLKVPSECVSLNAIPTARAEVPSFKVLMAFSVKENGED